VNKRRRLAALLLLVAALALALLGQFYALRRREYLWDGLVFYGLAALCFVLAWRQATASVRAARTDRPRSLPWGAWIRERPISAGLLVAGLFLSLSATLLSAGRAWNQPTTDVVFLWLLGLTATALAALWPTSWPARPGREWLTRLRQVSRETWLEAATLAGLTLLALLLRVSALGRVPFTLGGDEAWHGLLARQVLTGELRNPFVMGYMSMPTFFYWPLSWSLRLAPSSMTALRLPAALVGAATIPILYLFARRLWGRQAAFLAALFLAAYDYHVHYSRLGANNVWDALFVLLALWTLDRGLTASTETGQTRFLILTGLVMGLSAYFYTGARLLPPLVAIYLLFLWVQQRFHPERARAVKGLDRRLVLLLVLAFLIAAGPMLNYALTHPDDWNARLNQVGIIQSGWLAREPGLTGKSTLQILAEQFLRAAGAFHVFPDRTVWYGAQRPLLGPLAGVFALLGMVWALAHWRERRYFLVLLWFWSVVISGGMLTESPPSSQRLVIAIPAVALLVAFGLEQTVRLARALLRVDRHWGNLVLGLLGLVLAANSVRFYFVDYSPTSRYGSRNGETATMIGHYLHGLEGEQRAYFFGAPRIYWKFGTMAFLAPNVSGQDVVEPLEGPPDFVEEKDGVVFVFLPQRAGERSWVEKAFPDGRWREFRDAGGSLRFLAYEVP